jgi:transposase
VLMELTVAEQRFNAVIEVLRDGLTVIEVAGRYGVSRQTVHGWLRRYRTGGLDALADRSHRPRQCPHQMPAAVEAQLLSHNGWRLVRCCQRGIASTASETFALLAPYSPC